jgi:hypothetical protein
MRLAKLEQNVEKSAFGSRAAGAISTHAKSIERKVSRMG